MKETYDEHQSVMLNEVIENIAIQPDGIYLDATFGRGGHSSSILNKLGPHGKLYAMDKDPEAVTYAQRNFQTDKRFKIHHGSFIELAAFLQQEQVLGKVSGILLDLGVSSPQLDDPDRGFSFMRAGKLDMRMDTTRGIDAANWLAEASEEELANVFWLYGEERYSRRIAKAIVSERQQTAITTTDQLASIIAKAHPNWQKGKHPATRCFQAIRIKINQELEDLKQVLTQSVEALAVGGRLLVISFHSLEDRIVKEFMHKEERGEELPAGLPVKHQELNIRFKRLGRAIKPSAKELAQNPRARSAILRIGEKLL